MTALGMLFFAATLAGTGLAFLLGGLPLALIYFVLWFDKAVIGMGGGMIRKIGIDLTTIVAVATGVLYGPVAGFFLILIFVPVFQAARDLLIGMESEWPLFVPSPWTLGYAIGAVGAGLLSGTNPFFVVIVALVIETIVFFVYEKLAQKPLDVISAATSFIFNLIIYPIVTVPFFAAVGVLA